MGSIHYTELIQLFANALFEYTGQKLFEVYDFFVRNPSVSGFVRRKSSKRHFSKRSVRVSAAKMSAIGDPSMFVPRSSSKVDICEEYELPKDTPYTAQPHANETLGVDKEKYESLERELTNLKSQMSLFMQSQSLNQQQNGATISLNPIRVNVDTGGERSNNANSKFAMGQSQIQPSTVPPPPPLPPSTPRVSKSYSLASISVREGSSLLTCDRSKLSTNGSEGDSLSDSIKVAYKKGLRKVDGVRSPGGTVSRAASESDSVLRHPADVIAFALKKKFKNIRAEDVVTSDQVVVTEFE